MINDSLRDDLKISRIRHAVKALLTPRNTVAFQVSNMPPRIARMTGISRSVANNSHMCAGPKWHDAC
jgi:hypothetical protein